MVGIPSMLRRVRKTFTGVLVGNINIKKGLHFVADGRFARRKAGRYSVRPQNGPRNNDRIKRLTQKAHEKGPWRNLGRTKTDATPGSPSYRMRSLGGMVTEATPYLSQLRRGRKIFRVVNPPCWRRMHDDMQESANLPNRLRTPI